MSEADNLLATLSVDYSDEAYIYVNDDRTIVVPDELKHIAVEHDHNIETVTFDCPHYWDEHDFSAMTPYINYMRPDGYKDSYPAKNLRVSDEDDTRILFDWTISANVTQIKGNLSFLVYIEDSDANPCWHSRLNQQMVIDEGLTCVNQTDILPDSIEDLLSSKIATQLEYVKTQIDAKAAEALETIPEDYTTTYNLANEAVRTKADAIVRSATGELIKLTDCSNDYIRGLSVFGKTMQVSTTGKNLWDNASAYMPHTAVITRTETGFSFVRGDVTGGFYASYNIPILAGQTVTFSAEGSSYAPSLIIYSDAVYGTQVKSGTRVLTYTSASAISTAVFAVVINSTDTDNNITNIQVEVSSERTAYEPYSGGFSSPSPDWPQTPVGIENPRLGIAGGNLFDASRIASVSKGGAIITNNGDGSFFINGTGNASEICSTEYSISNEEMKLLFHPGTLRLVTDTQTNPIVFVNLYKNGSFLSTILSSTWARDYSYTLTDDHFESDIYSLRIGFHANAGTTIIPGTVTPILTQFSGDVQSTYQGYTIASRAVSCVLHGIPVNTGGNYTDANGQQWICDEIDFARGVHIQRVAVKTLDGSIAYQEAGTQTAGTYTAFVSHADIWNNENDPFVSDRFVGYPGADYKTSSLEGVYTNPGVMHCNLIILRIDKTRLDTTTYSALEALRVFLDDNPVTVYAPLLKPIETELTAEEMAKLSIQQTFYPRTTILNDVGAGMSIKYNADTKSYVDERGMILTDTSTGLQYKLTVVDGALTLVAV